MALESKPLFHPEVLRQQVRAFNLPERVADWQPKLQHWAGLIASGRADDFKKTALLPDFLTDIFCGLLGYTGPASALRFPLSALPISAFPPARLRPRRRNLEPGARPERPRQPGLLTYPGRGRTSPGRYGRRDDHSRLLSRSQARGHQSVRAVRH